MNASSDHFDTEIIPNITYPDPYDTNIQTKTLHMDRGIYLMESLWRNEISSLSVDIKLSDNNSYNLLGLKELNTATLTLHQTINPHNSQNLITRPLVFGLGATQCLHAAIYACAEHCGKQLIVTAQLPGYLEYKNLINIHHKGSAVWMDINKVLQLSDQSNVLEIVCSPNNPDGRILHKITNSTYSIHDRINHWPFFTHKTNDYFNETFDNDQITIFSYPKILGFSASRVGYAFVKHDHIATLMQKYIVYACHGLCTEGQLKCLTALNYILKSPQHYMDMLSQYCTHRWDTFEKAISHYNSSHTDIILLLNHQGPTAWIKLPSNSKQWLLSKLNLVATYGPEYGTTDDYARINLLSMPNEFNELIRRLYI